MIFKKLFNKKQEKQQEEQNYENRTEFTEINIYNIIILFYFFIGFLYICKDKHLHPKYALVLAFCTIKMIFNYRKCTVSYYECKVRGVKREDGVLAGFLDYVVDLRYSKYNQLIYTVVIIYLLFTENLQEKIKFLNKIKQ